MSISRSSRRSSTGCCGSPRASSTPPTATGRPATASRSVGTRRPAPRWSAMTALWFAHLAPTTGSPSSRMPRRSSTPSSTCSATSTARTSRRCAPAAACSPTRAVPRTPTGRLLDRIGRARCRGPLFAAPSAATSTPTSAPPPRSRFVALVGDAELDEGNVWEAITDPATQGLGNVMWIVDFNRQSLDRVVPGMRIASGAAVRRRRLARRRGQVRRAAAGPRSSSRGRGAAAGSTTCRTSSTRRCSGWPAPSCGAVPGRRAEPSPDRRRRGVPTPIWPAGPGPRRPRPRRMLTRMRSATPDRPAERGIRLHRQGLGPADRRQPAQPLGAARRRAGRHLPRTRWA